MPRQRNVSTSGRVLVALFFARFIFVWFFFFSREYEDVVLLLL